MNTTAPPRASIRQVAELARVSPITVTRVLRGQAGVAEETRERVLAAVRRTNYIPVRSAVQNRHSITHVVGLVPYFSDLTEHRIDSDTYKGICRVARREGYDLLVLLRDESDWMADRAEMRFLDRRSDGFVFISAESGEWQTALEKLVQHAIPVVVCYRRDVPDGIAWVDPDNDAIIELLVDTMARRGHRRIGYLPGRGGAGENGARIATAYDDAMRQSAFARMAREAGVHGIVLGTALTDWTPDPRVLEEIRGKGVTGVICVNDLLALRLWDLAEDAGLRIPHDLSIAGVDDLPEAEMRGLTSVAFGYDRIGEEAMKSWVRLIRSESPADCCRVVPVDLCERASVAGPSSFT